MKKLLLLLCVAILVGLAGCGSLPSIAGLVSQGVKGTASQAAETADADLHSDEVLASLGDATLIQSAYAIAKVLTPPSDSTKNQAKVLSVTDGSERWSKWLMLSRKAEKADFAVGSWMLVENLNRSFTDPVSSSHYRGQEWKLRRVTSVDDLFKDIVTIGGYTYHIRNIRVPTIKIEE